MRLAAFATHPLQLALGLAVWLAWFGIAYGGLSLGCAIAAPPPEAGAGTWINWSVALFTAATAALLLWCAWVCGRAVRACDPPSQPAKRFIPLLGAAVHLIAVVCTLFIGVSLVLLPPCL